MNSSDGPTSNGILQDDEQERASSSGLSNSDTNANVNDGIDRSKGAIPKIKSVSKSINTSQRKSIKFNNNLEEIPSLNGAASNCERDSERNGFDKECENIVIDEKIKCSSRELSHSFDYQSPQLDYDVAVNFHTLCLKKNETKDDSENSSDDTELLSISDDGCIYTYKGDNAADLPESFFSLDIPILENQNVVERNSSPEMDFLEMDFDPGPAGDIDSDSVSNSDADPVRVTATTIQPIAERIDENLINGAASLLSCNQQNNTITSCQTVREKTESIKCETTKSQTIEDIKMPWSCVLSQRTTGFPCWRSVKRQHNSCGELVSPVDPASPLEDQNCSICSYSPQKSLLSVKRAMIWSEEEAANNQVVQIGASACGATAVLNVLKALRFPLPTREKLQEAVQTRLRANLSPFVEYLLSRSSAGTTHQDLITGLHKLSDGRIYARFFSMFPERVVNLNMWLSFWIENGAVPIATLNLQKGIQPIPDAWHHQMIYGVTEEGIYLTNPLEFVKAEDLWPQLCSDSVLLIKQEDVMCRWNREEFIKLMKVKDGRWRRLNVVGQTARMVLESWREQKTGFSRMTHICIPAEYSAGITLAIEITSPAFSLLSDCPDLPLLDDLSS